MMKIVALIFVAVALISTSIQAKETFSTKTIDRSKSKDGPGNNWIGPMGEDDKHKQK